jgi:hypothetical protein
MRHCPTRRKARLSTRWLWRTNCSSIYSYKPFIYEGYMPKCLIISPTTVRYNMSRQSVWATKVLCLIKGGNSTAAIAQIKVAPTVKDLQDLRKMLSAAKLLASHPNVDAATDDMIAALSAPRLHRAP